jgi:hypothetical protein
MQKSSLTLLIILFFTIYSCEKKQFPQKDKNGTRIFYDIDEYVRFEINHPKEKVIIIDTFCISEEKRAINDIKKNNLTYYMTLGFEKKEFEKILASLNLKSKSIEPHGGFRYGKFNRNCYQNEMNKELERRYGNDFFDSIRTLARKLYIKKHPNEVYIEDGRDIREVY